MYCGKFVQTHSMVRDDRLDWSLGYSRPGFLEFAVKFSQLLIIGLSVVVVGFFTHAR